MEQVLHQEPTLLTLILDFLACRLESVSVVLLHLVCGTFVTSPRELIQWDYGIHSLVNCVSSGPTLAVSTNRNSPPLEPSLYQSPGLYTTAWEWFWSFCYLCLGRIFVLLFGCFVWVFWWGVFGFLVVVTF